MELTDRQMRVYGFIRDFIEEYQVPPTRAEICHGLGFRSPNAAEEHLRTLERKGYVELYGGSSRGIRLLTNENESKGIPVVGRVAAGRPVLAERNIEGYVAMDPSLFSPGADYFLRVRGMSMRDVGILDGDLLAVAGTAKVRSGQIVVVRLGDEVSVKRMKRSGGKVTLLSENRDFQPVTVNPKTDPFSIEGLGVGVLRNGRLG